MTNPQDPFATPAEGSTPSRPASPPTWEQPATPTWGQQPAYGQPAYGQPGQGGWGGPPAGERRNGLGTAALVTGIVALVTSWFGLGGLVGIAAIVLGIIGLGRVRRREADNRGMAIAGIVLGAVSILIAGLFLLGLGLIFGSDTGKQFTECLAQAGGDQAALDACEQEFNRGIGAG